MNKLLLEIGLEEIPSMYIDRIIADLEKNTKDIFNKMKIEYKNIYSFGTPRRIGIYLENLEEKQKDEFRKIKGPSKNIAFDENGKPTQPAIKFAQANNLAVEELVVEETNKGDYLFASKTIKGCNTVDLLPDILKDIISSFNFQKTMKWGKSSLRFIRPIRWLLALYNEEVIPISIEYIKSDRKTFGHLLLSPDYINVCSVDDYFEKIEKSFVIIDPIKREKLIREQSKKALKKINANNLINEKLLKEVKNIVEFPRILTGQFDANYLKLPTEVLESVMINHQKYFPVYSEEGNLLPFFLVAINGNDLEFSKKIITGNERVLKARLEDAIFFYQEDLKTAKRTSKPLDEKLEKLKKVIFQENAGSLFDKTERLIALSEKLGFLLNLDTEKLKNIKRTAQICKTDLISEMVKEFPELQGIIGKEYALLQGENKEVADGIYEHYLPRSANDFLPKTESGIIVSIADKLDNIVSCFLNNIIPDGSQDPYALRRQSLGIINIVINNKLDIPLGKLIDLNIKLILGEDDTIYNIHKLRKDVISFILQRFKNLALEQGYNYDIIDAVLSKDNDNILDVLSRITTINKIYNTSNFGKIITAATRSQNLSKNLDNGSYFINEMYFQTEEEKLLFNEYTKLSDKINNSLKVKKYKEVLHYLEELNEPLDIYFDNVLVMEKDITIRNNRLSLLKKIAEIYNSLADLSKIALAKGNFK